jgi:hypothetical protein
MGIQKIQRIRWRSRESRRYGGDPEDPKDTIVAVSRIDGIRFSPLVKITLGLILKLLPFLPRTNII